MKQNFYPWIWIASFLAIAGTIGLYFANRTKPIKSLEQGSYHGLLLKQLPQALGGNPFSDTTPKANSDPPPKAVWRWGKIHDAKVNQSTLSEIDDSPLFDGIVPRQSKYALSISQNHFLIIPGTGDIMQIWTYHIVEGVVEIDEFVKSIENANLAARLLKSAAAGVSDF
jgi:hypothetical protein